MDVRVAGLATRNWVSFSRSVKFPLLNPVILQRNHNV